MSILTLIGSFNDDANCAYQKTELQSPEQEMAWANPILRSPEEHETVYKTLKLIPDINDQLSDEELRELMACIVREYWVKGSTGYEFGNPKQLYLAVLWNLGHWGSHILLD
ncbi:UNVERIFIED_CONTAM: hypothetical protein K2H54_036339 [Gekko kuhli]